ncbi:hypothetical protein [Shouchella patagoniensis]|uniref:hypothetical protein n=1 Tax=Shouchella patagoniensis TaxID=228576 RepID=UPI0009956177|nr:hypothetical protein [Shouchella patagoniensis]
MKETSLSTILQYGLINAILIVIITLITFNIFNSQVSLFAITILGIMAFFLFVTTALVYKNLNET